MTVEVGYASLGIIPSFKGFESKLNSGTSGVMTKAGVASGTKFGDAAGKQAGSRFGGAFKTAAKASLVGLGALGVGAIKLASDSVTAASDLEESTNKVSEVFGKGADDIFRFSSKAADALGQTNQAARDAAATFGIFGKVAGLTDQKNARFAKRMTTLASDLASFSNTSPDEAIEAIGAALRGEAEPIRKYGVLLDEATLKAEAMSMGLLKPVKDQSKIKAYQVAILEGQKKYNDALKEHGKGSVEVLKAEANLGTARDRLKKATEGTIPPLTQQQKVLAAQSSILKQTEVAQGDFARTSDGLANQQRRLAARFEDAKARLGKGLLPIMTDAADFILDKGLPAFESFADWFNKDGIPAIKNFADEVEPAIGFVKDLVEGFKGLPNSTKLAALATVLGAGALGSMKFGGGSSGKGVTGAVGKALGLAKGQPVYVTNWAQIGAASGGGGGLVGGSPTTKLGKAAAGLSRAVLPVAIVAYSAAALKGFWDWNHQDDKGKPLSYLSGGRVGDFMRNHFGNDSEASRLEKVAAAYKGINDASRKLPNQLDLGRTAGQKLADELFDIGGKLKDIERPRRVKIDAPNLLNLLDLTKRYGSLLDGLDGRNVTTYVNSTQRNNATGEGGGVSPQPPGRSGGNFYVTVKADDPMKFKRDAEHMQRTAAIGGADFRG